MATNNSQYSTRYCWDAEKVKALIRLRAELSPLFTGKRNASKYAWAVVERELNVPLPLSKIIKKWNNLLQEYKAIKISEEPKRREWPFFTLMDVYFSDQVNDPSLRLFSSTKTLKESLDESVFEDDPIIASAIAAATSSASMELEELLKLKKEKRANENKYTAEKNFNSRATDYSMGSSKANVITIKNNNFMQRVDNTNNTKPIGEQPQNAPKNEKLPPPPRATFQQRQSPIPPPPPPPQQQQQQLQQQQQQQPQPTTQNKYPDPNTIDQYLLSWNNFLGNMSRGFHTLQKDEKMVDVTIAAGGKIFKAHKLVLSVCSPYFQEIFLENPSNHPILLMADVEANHMAGLLNFMYSGQVNVKYEDLPVFLKVAEAMKIKGLHTEKPGGQNLREFQFSPENNLPDFQVINSSSISIPIDVTAQSPTIALSKDEEVSCHTTYAASPHNAKLPEPFYQNTHDLNLDQSKKRFSILKTNAGKKILDQIKQQKYFTKRKVFSHPDSDISEKRMQDTTYTDQYYKPQSKVMYLPETTSHVRENFNNEEVLNLTQNGVPNIPPKFLPINTSDLKNACQQNQLSFTEIRNDNITGPRVINDEVITYGIKSCEDGNKNSCREENKSGQKNSSYPGTEESGSYPNDGEKISEITNKPSNNDGNNNYHTDMNSMQNHSVLKSHKHNDDEPNNGCGTKNNESITGLLRKHADSNNNVFISSTSSPEAKQSDTPCMR